jgi:hypothetical protein
MISIAILLAVLIVEIWIVAKLIDHTLLCVGEEVEKVKVFLIEIRNAVVKVRPGDVPQCPVCKGYHRSHMGL